MRRTSSNRLRMILPVMLMFAANMSAKASEAYVSQEISANSDPGEMLLHKKCGACHGVPDPVLHSREIWPGVVYRMQMRIGARGMAPLDKEELGLVIEYLQRNAADTP